MLTNQMLILFFSMMALVGCQSCGSPEEELPQTGVHGELTGIPRIDAITRDIKANPDNMSLRVLRCEAYSEEGLLKEAEKEAEIIYEHDKTNWKSARLLAYTYMDNNRSKPAIKILERALEIHPDTIQLLLLHSDFNLTVKHYDEALISAEKALKISPLNVEGLFMRGMVLKYIGDTLNAIGNWQTAIEQDADHYDAYIQLGNVFSRRGQKIAIQYYDNALRIDSLSYEALKGKSNFYQQNYTEDNGMKEQYKAAFERVALHHPQEADVWYDHALFCMDEGDFEQGHHFMEIAVKYDPQFGEAYYYKGYCNEKIGNADAAIVDYENAIRNNSEGNAAQNALKRLKQK